MLKSIDCINKISDILKSNIEAITNYYIELSLNQTVFLTIVSNSVSTKEQLFTDYLHALKDEYEDLIDCDFISIDEFEDEQFDDIRNKPPISYGVRRSLDSLLSPSNSKQITLDCPIVTFFSYKGGVGRTTSLAMFASYYADQGKNVFVIDCDFEAPGLINFFGISQFHNPKSGVIEFLCDKKFDNRIKVSEEYFYEVPSIYSGEGKIQLMPAGNVFGDDKISYLEGLSRIDVHGQELFEKEFSELIAQINQNYKPDLILIDSRTGFNNIFGTLAQLSNEVIYLSGDDNQNYPGLEFVVDSFASNNFTSNISFVLSIISSAVLKRFRKFKDKIETLYSDYATEDNSVSCPCYYFQRESILELVGTDYEDLEDYKLFLKDGLTSGYRNLFEDLTKKLETYVDDFNNDVSDDTPENVQPLDDKTKVNTSEQTLKDVSIEPPSSKAEKKIVSDEIASTTVCENTELSIHNEILEKLKNNFPEPYAEEEDYNDKFLNSKFYVRQCMLDILLPQNKILLGIKGSGKTAFYKALQSENFFNSLVKRAEKSHLNFQILNVVINQTSDSDNKAFNISSHFSEELNSEVFTRRLWTIYIWSRIIEKYAVRSGYNSSVTFEFVLSNTDRCASKFKEIINDDHKYLQIENDLEAIEAHLKKNDERLIITFDELDYVVKPIDWDLGISPLLRLCMSKNWDRIQPKLFIRRDLFNKLGNYTNRHILERSVIDLEWRHEEIYAFFFKVIAANSKDEFIKFLYSSLNSEFVKKNVVRKINKINHFNQLPSDELTLRPIVNKFFGESIFSHGDSYDTIYSNLRNADNTISLRPFLDLIKYAIEAQEQDNFKQRGSAVLSAKYCFQGKVRSKAVDRYFTDLSSEIGNEPLKHFVLDIKNNLVSDSLKYSSLLQSDFEKIVNQVKENHQELSKLPIAKIEENLITNGIIFISYLSGTKKKYSFAYLYKHFLGLKSPNSRRYR